MAEFLEKLKSDLDMLPRLGETNDPSLLNSFLSRGVEEKLQYLFDNQVYVFKISPNFKDLKLAYCEFELSLKTLLFHVFKSKHVDSSNENGVEDPTSCDDDEVAEIDGKKGSADETPVKDR